MITNNLVLKNQKILGAGSSITTNDLILSLSMTTNDLTLKYWFQPSSHLVVPYEFFPPTPFDPSVYNFSQFMTGFYGILGLYFVWRIYRIIDWLFCSLRKDTFLILRANTILNAEQSYNLTRQILINTKVFLIYVGCLGIIYLLLKLHFWYPLFTSRILAKST